MIILSSIYILLGFFILILPSIFLELGRPNDLLIGGFILLTGVFLILKQNIFVNSLTVFVLINFVLMVFLLLEIFSIRWNQLSEKEKIKLKNFNEILKNFSLFFYALLGGFKKIYSVLNIFNFNKSNPIKKKWIRLDENPIQTNLDKKASSSTPMQSKTTQPKIEDIINPGKNESNRLHSDKK